MELQADPATTRDEPEAPPLRRSTRAEAQKPAIVDAISISSDEGEPATVGPSTSTRPRPKARKQAGNVKVATADEFSIPHFTVFSDQQYGWVDDPFQ